MAIAIALRSGCLGVVFDGSSSEGWATTEESGEDTDRASVVKVGEADAAAGVAGATALAPAGGADEACEIAADGAAGMFCVALATE